MRRTSGFTIVELLVIIATIGILVAIIAVSYGAWQNRITTDTVKSDLQQAKAAMKTRLNFNNSYPANLGELGSSFKPSPDISLSLVLAGSSSGPTYDNLTSVQNAVLFHETCRQIMTEPEFKTLYSKDGSATNSSYNLWCGSSDGVNGINAGYYQINSWNSTQWRVPITEAQLQNRVDHPPTDSWWDIATLDGKTYAALISRFKAAGGIFPITTIWDSWATCGAWGCSGVLKDPLPPPSSESTVSSDDGYCVTAASQKYADVIWHITARSEPIQGSC